MPPPDVAAIVLAAGSGDRFGGPKQFMHIGPRRLVDLAVECVATVAATVVVVVPRSVAWDGPGIGATGGATRGESVRNGLVHVPATVEVVVVHDAAHPLAPADLAARLWAKARTHAAGRELFV